MAYTNPDGTAVYINDAGVASGGFVVANSTASEIAVPNEPGWCGSRVMISFPARVDIDGEPSTVAPKVRMIELR